MAHAVRLWTVFSLLCVATVAQGQSFEGPLHSDWRCTSMPNDRYRPGVVYKKDGTGYPTFVKDLNKERLRGFQVENGTAKLGRVTQSATAGGMVKVGLLERVFKAAKASLGLEAEKRENYDVEYEVSAWNFLSEGSIAVASEWIRRNATDKRPSVTYWLIREGLEASRISYRISTGLVGQLGGEAEIMNKLSATVKSGGAKESHYVLERPLSPPGWVCQVAQRMSPESNLMGGTTWKVEPRVPLDLPEPEIAP